MKLLNITTTWFAGLLVLIISLWATAFYFSMLEEIYDSMDDGLDNQKQLIIQKAAHDSSVLRRTSFEEGSYRVRELPPGAAFPVKDVFVDTFMYMQNEDEFEPVRLLRTSFRQNNRQYELRVITSMVEADDLVQQLLVSLLWLYLGLVSSILLLNNLLLKKIWGPFYRLLHRLANFRLDKPVPLEAEKTEVTEFQLLHAVVQNLLQSNIDTYDSQKQFIENAAHELQTPLAISLNKLEMLAETNTLSEEQGRLVADVLENLERLGRLNKSLLLLSRIENRQFESGEVVNFNELIKRTVQDFDALIEYKKISVSISEEGACRHTLNPGLASVLMSNLVKNALVHNLPSGYVHIRIRENLLQFENSGKAAPLDKVHLFDRFYKEEQSMSSTGLGLAIVKAIGELYGYHIDYHFEGKHILSLQFPSATL
ncbi:HAMP domain-containing sensor histidine kinase [Paraflavisolibacter sp. H34]|uniref:sensor histidine kinase n=1 Tax=Huijunlia imazamoxiresistens TaxID=3127457 RepID=UPI0030198B05